MAQLELSIAPALYARLIAELAAPAERVVFLGAHASLDRGQLVVADLYTTAPDEVASGELDHVALTDAAIENIIRWGHQRSASLIEAHAHRGRRPARLSWIDLDGLAAWVPHVRWRLASRPYVALVFADDSYDGLAWVSDDGRAARLGGLRIGGRIVRPTGLTFDLMRDRALAS